MLTVLKSIGDFPTTKRGRLLLSLAASAAICLFFAICHVAGNSNDDWLISLVLSGRLNNSGLSLFLNAILSMSIYGLNCMFPFANWFFVVEHFSTFLAFAALFYGVLTYARRLPGFIMLGLIAWKILPCCISYSNFTYIAFICTCAGCFLLVGRLTSDEAGVASSICGSFLVVLGLMWRFQMFLAGIPFMGIAYLWNAFRHKDKGELSLTLAIFIKRMRPCFLCLLACAILFVANSFVWSQPDWEEWRAYNESRSVTSDSPMPEYADVANQLASIGVSENDYWMIRHWASGDTDTINTELITKVAELKVSASSTSDFLEQAGSYALRLFTNKVFVISLIVMLFTLGFEDKRTYMLAVLEVLCAFIVCVYYALIGRLIARAEDPTWFYALCMCVAMSKKQASEQQEDWVLPTLKTLAGLCIFVLLCGHSLYKVLPNFNFQKYAATFSQEAYVSKGGITQYEADHPEQSYVLDETGLHLFSMEHGLRFLPAASIAERTIFLGSWTSGSPLTIAQCQQVGATNPVAALVSSDNPAFLISTEDMAQHVLVFVQEHYNAQAQLELVEHPETFDKALSVYRIVT